MGISLRWSSCYSFRRCFMFVSNQGQYLLWKKYKPMNDKREIPWSGRSQSWSKEKLKAAGQFPLAVRSYPKYSTLSWKKSHLLSLNERRYFVKTCATQLKKHIRVEIWLENKRILSMMMRSLQIIFVGD